MEAYTFCVLSRSQIHRAVSCTLSPKRADLEGAAVSQCQLILDCWQALEWMQSMAQIGEAFSQSKSSNLRDAMQRHSGKFFQAYHASNLQANSSSSPSLSQLAATCSFRAKLINYLAMGKEVFARQYNPFCFCKTSGFMLLLPSQSKLKILGIFYFLSILSSGPLLLIAGPANDA